VLRQSSFDEVEGYIRTQVHIGSFLSLWKRKSLRYRFFLSSFGVRADPFKSDSKSMKKYLKVKKTSRIPHKQEMSAADRLVAPSSAQHFPQLFQTTSACRAYTGHRYSQSFRDLGVTWFLNVEVEKVNRGS